MSVSRLAGKIAIVTGAGAGIGRAVSETFAAQGAKVVVAGIPGADVKATAEAIRDSGGIALAMTVDVTDSGQMQAMVDETVRIYGGIDVIFNNAGVAHDTLVEDTTDQIWDHVVDVTLKGVFLGCRAVMPVMKAAGRGSIINSGSTAATVGFTKRSAYCAAKGGVVSLTRALAIEVAPFGVRVNCIVPGATDTQMVRDIYDLQVDPAIARKAHWDRQPLGRLSSVEDISAAVLFMATDEASTMTGSTLVVDSGYSAA